MDHEKLIAFITGNQTLRENPTIEDLINQQEDNKEEFIRYKNLWALMQTGNEISKEQIATGYRNVKNRTSKNSKAPVYINFIKYAAIFILVLLGGYSINLINFSDNKAIVKNEIFVPNGSRSSVILSDGTKVWLSNGTKFIYPEKFTGESRNVELEGEGFFEVTKNKKHPFIVKLGKNRIKVLGTTFAVIAYPNDKTIKTELISGAIQFDIGENKQTDKFQSHVLKPSQSLVYNKTSGRLVESKISDNFYQYWLNGVYEFKDEAFEDLAVKIDRIYNVKITFEDEIFKKRLFSGTLTISDNIYTLMEVFAKASANPFTYTHNGNIIYIKAKNK